MIVIHKFLELKIPSHPCLHLWSDCFRKSVELDYFKIHREGLMKINHNNPIKTIDNVTP